LPARRKSRTRPDHPERTPNSNEIWLPEPQLHRSPGPAPTRARQRLPPQFSTGGRASENCSPSRGKRR
jgi:hypothetical protein